ncbi:MAG: ATP-dependent helicase [Blautia sp.]|nr:ATP-dependent helicase [Blautia sp.]
MSARQKEIINDKESRCIVVAAGPGSGMTRVLVHKLASLLLLEDVKHEQLLMLTFSRAAAMEFKLRLRELIQNAASFVEIKTFHSFCFDLLGKVGNLRDSQNVVRDAVTFLRGPDVDLSRVTKTVLVIDEAQDMDEAEYSLVRTLMELNEEMRLIAVGDDDQNIYHFRGSDSRFLRLLAKEEGARQYSLLENYRSCTSVISFANHFARSITERMKEEDIRAVRGDAGEVKLISHKSSPMEPALVEDLLACGGKGSSCILTGTNQEALLILGILKQKGIPARFIQSMDGFEIWDIVEIRFFCEQISRQEHTPVINSNAWNYALHALEERYQGDMALPLIRRILETFAQINERKYRTDLEMFLHESRIEDFYDEKEEEKRGIVTVSTIHKSKGREFDHVFILLPCTRIDTDEERRRLYVGMTRAKNLLHIHYAGHGFDGFLPYATLSEVDERDYPRPSEVILQLSHREVYLDFFRGKGALISKLKSGDHLYVRGNRLFTLSGGREQAVLQFSKKCMQDIGKLEASGYRPVDSVVRFICMWTKKEDKTECPLILADILFGRQKAGKPP